MINPNPPTSSSHPSNEPQATPSPQAPTNTPLPSPSTGIPAQRETSRRLLDIKFDPFDSQPSSPRPMTPSHRLHSLDPDPNASFQDVRRAAFRETRPSSNSKEDYYLRSLNDIVRIEDNVPSLTELIEAALLNKCTSLAFTAKACVFLCNIVTLNLRECMESLAQMMKDLERSERRVFNWFPMHLFEHSPSWWFNVLRDHRKQTNKTRSPSASARFLHPTSSSPPSPSPSPSPSLPTSPSASSHSSSSPSSRSANMPRISLFQRARHLSETQLDIKYAGLRKTETIIAAFTGLMVGTVAKFGKSKTPQLLRHRVTQCCKLIALFVSGISENGLAHISRDQRSKRRHNKEESSAWSHEASTSSATASTIDTDTATRDQVNNLTKAKALLELLGDSEILSNSQLCELILHCLTVLPSMLPSLYGDLTRYQRKGHFARYWLPYTGLGLSFLATSLFLFKHSSFCGSNDLQEWQTSANETIKLFIQEHITDPARAIRKEFSFLRDYDIKGAALELEQTRESLRKMLIDFTQEKYENAPTAEEYRNALNLAEKGDISAIMGVYEEEVQSPVLNLVGGDLMRAFLIQIQKIKEKIEAEMLEIDKMMRANELNLQIMATIPAMIFAGIFFTGCKKLFYRIRDRNRIDPWLLARHQLREIECILTRNLHQEGGSIYLQKDTQFSGVSPYQSPSKPTLHGYEEKTPSRSMETQPGPNYHQDNNHSKYNRHSQMFYTPTLTNRHRRVLRSSSSFPFLSAVDEETLLWHSQNQKKQNQLANHNLNTQDTLGTDHLEATLSHDEDYRYYQSLSQHEGSHMSPEDMGLFVFAMMGLERIANEHFHGTSRRQMNQDLKDLRSITLTLGQKLDVVRRMYRTHKQLGGY